MIKNDSNKSGIKEFSELKGMDVQDLASLCLENAIQGDFSFLLSPQVASNALLTKFNLTAGLSGLGGGSIPSIDFPFFQWSTLQAHGPSHNNTEAGKRKRISYQDLVALDFRNRNAYFKVLDMETCCAVVYFAKYKQQNDRIYCLFMHEEQRWKFHGLDFEEDDDAKQESPFSMSLQDQHHHDGAIGAILPNPLTWFPSLQAAKKDFALQSAALDSQKRIPRDADPQSQEELYWRQYDLKFNPLPDPAESKRKESREDDDDEDGIAKKIKSSSEDDDDDDDYWNAY